MGEHRTGSFEAVTARITGTPIPLVSFGLISALQTVPVVTWLMVPLLVRRDSDLGRYLASMFFASMGLVELTHSIMPWLAGESFGCFPGMLSAGAAGTARVAGNVEFDPAASIILNDRDRFQTVG